MQERFPFGAPVQSMARIPSGPRRVFMLGAYPSALHVRWVPPPDSDLKPVRALAVDNEPEPFWDGDGEDELVAAWQAERFGAQLGKVFSAGQLNGSSGRWVKERVLKPLAAAPDEVWFTDCLDTYRASRGQDERIADTYAPFADNAGLPAAVLSEHPSEDAIVREARDGQRDRLLQELKGVSPDLVVTLGSAAARVFHELIGLDGEAPPLSRDDYGAFVHVSCLDRPVQWVALAHPGAPQVWQRLHEDWVSSLADEVESSGD